MSFIRDKHSPFIYTLFSIFVKGLYKIHFKHIYVQKPHLSTNESYLILLNHYTWWDGILPMFIHKKFHKPFNAKGIMDTKQLEKLMFFRNFGVFSIDRDYPKNAINSLKYGAEHLSKKQSLLFLFPQGAIYPNDAHFIQIENGYKRLLKYEPTAKLVVYVSYIEQMYHKKPNLWIKGLLVDKNEDIEVIFKNVLTTLKEDALNKANQNFETIK